MLNRHGILYSGLLISKFLSKLKCTLSSVCSQKELDITEKNSTEAMQDLQSNLFSILKRFSTGMLFIFELNVRFLIREVDPDVPTMKK